MGLVLLALFPAFGLALAGSASATVVVDHSSSSPTCCLLAGDLFTVDVRVTWDGQGAPTGIFASTGYDHSVIEFVDAEYSATESTAPSIFDQPVPYPPGVLPGLQRAGDLQRPGDPMELLRTVQYAAASALDPAAAGDVLVTRLTFRLIGSGTTHIAAVLFSGDSGVVGDAFMQGSTVQVTYVGPPIPEPGAGVLLGLGLTGLATRRRR